MKPQITSKFRCVKGHEYVSNNGEPVRFSIDWTGGRISTGPVCPVCYIDWLSSTFPVTEVSRIETVIDEAKLEPVN